MLFRLLSRLSSGYTGLMMGLTVAGLVAIGWGSQIGSELLIALGGGVFGATLGLVMGELNSGVAYEKLRALVSEERAPRFISSEAEIANYRVVWHHYHRTRMETGEPMWRYRLYDFRDRRFVGELRTAVVAKDSQGREYVYNVAAGMRHPRLVSFETAGFGSEPHVVEIYPFMAHDYLGTHCGIGVLDAWDGKHLVAPCIMSRDPILPEGTAEGDVSQADRNHLDTLWQRDFRRDNMLP